MKTRKYSGLFTLIFSLLLFSQTIMADECPVIPNFSLMDEEQGFVRCTYASKTIYGADVDHSLCIKTFSKIMQPYSKKESCYYDDENDACICMIGFNTP